MNQVYKQLLEEAQVLLPDLSAIVVQFIGFPVLCFVTFTENQRELKEPENQRELKEISLDKTPWFLLLENYKHWDEINRHLHLKLFWEKSVNYTSYVVCLLADLIKTEFPGVDVEFMLTSALEFKQCTELYGYKWGYVGEQRSEQTNERANAIQAPVRQTPTIQTHVNQFKNHTSKITKWLCLDNSTIRLNQTLFDHFCCRCNQVCLAANPALRIVNTFPEGEPTLKFNEPDVYYTVRNGDYYTITFDCLRIVFREKIPFESSVKDVESYVCEECVAKLVLSEELHSIQKEELDLFNPNLVWIHCISCTNKESVSYWDNNAHIFPSSIDDGNIITSYGSQYEGNWIVITALGQEHLPRESKRVCDECIKKWHTLNWIRIDDADDLKARDKLYHESVLNGKCECCQ